MTIQSEATIAVLNRFSPVSDSLSKTRFANDEVSRERTFSLRIQHKNPDAKPLTLLDSFVQSFKELEAYK
jgi:hypothetical protein